MVARGVAATFYFPFIVKKKQKVAENWWLPGGHEVFLMKQSTLSLVFTQYCHFNK